MAEQSFKVMFAPLWHGAGGEALPHATAVYAGEEPDYGTEEVCIQTVILCSELIGDTWL